MSAIRKAVEDYLRLRRALGFKLRDHQAVLGDFVSFLEHQGASTITTQLALHWAKQPRNVQPAHWARRLSMVRYFAQHWSATDPRTEIPPLGLLPHRYHRRAPYIYTQDQITQLIEAAKQLPTLRGLRPWTYCALFGLMAITGLRVSEAIALNREDLDLTRGVLTIHRTKFGKTRLTPVHISTQHALRQYTRRRDRIHSKPKTSSLFLADRGTRLTDCMVRQTFIKLSRQIGLRSASDSHGPRLHDLRHTFAVRTLVDWYRAGLNIERQMPVLATYLGHTHVADTYWYLSATPELLSLAGARLEHILGELP